MSPLVSIIMGSTSDLPVMEKACKFLNDMQIPLKLTLSLHIAHRTQWKVSQKALRIAASRSSSPQQEWLPLCRE